MQTLIEPLRHDRRGPVVGGQLFQKSLAPSVWTPDDAARRLERGAKKFRRADFIEPCDVGRGSTPRRARIVTSIDSVGTATPSDRKAQP